MKRLVSVILVMSLLLLSFASCSENNSNEEKSADPTASDVVVTEEEETVAPEDLLPKEDYEGYSFRILNNLSNFAYTNIGENELTGEALDDAVFNRNKTVEDILNITFSIETMEWSVTKSTIQKVVTAGEDAYDFYTLDLSVQLGNVLNGTNINVLDIDSLSLENPWWNKKAIDSVTIGDAVYSFFGDLHTGYFESYGIAVFNKDILTDLNLEDPYECVRNNDWTLDKMIGMLDAAKIDKDGDGQWTVEDQYGLTMYESNFSNVFTTGADADMIKKDASGMPYWDGGDEHFVDAYTKVAGSIFYDKSNNAINAKGTLPGSLELYRLVFIYGRALFLVTQIGVLKDLRDVDFNLGVVPVPKYDEKQNDYRSLIFCGANACGIPVTNPDIERTGLVLEHMAAHSTKTVRNVYMNQTLDFKYIQDQEGQEMLDIVLSTGVFELAQVYDWGGLAGTVLGGINSGNTTIISKLAKLSSKVESGVQKTMESFEKLKNQ